MEKTKKTLLSFFFIKYTWGLISAKTRGAMEPFEGCKVCGNELEKNNVEKIFLGCEKDSAVLRIYNEVCTHCESSLNTEDTAKDIEKAINPILHKPPIGQRNDNRFQVVNLRIALNKSSFFSSKSKVPHKASLVNLSINGLQILTTKTLKIGNKYNVDLFAPSLAGPMNIKAKVIWSKIFRREFTDTYYRVGFKFIKTDKEIEDNLKKLESFSYVQNN